MGSFHFNYNKKSFNKEYLDSEKPFIKESNNKLSGYINENNNNFSPINKKLVKKSQIVELEFTEETNIYMKLIVFIKDKIGLEKTNLLIKAVNFSNMDTIRYSLDNNYEQTKKILGSDYDNVVNLIRQYLMKVENNENLNHHDEKNDFIKKHKKTQSLGSINFKQKI